MSPVIEAGIQLFCLFFMFGSQVAYAQYRFDNWTADNGLPKNSVRDIVQTLDGYLWLTTFDGLVRFDCVRFTVINTSNSPGIFTNRFVFLMKVKCSRTRFSILLSLPAKTLCFVDGELRSLDKTQGVFVFSPMLNAWV